jgi:hypothetical protein
MQRIVFVTGGTGFVGLNLIQRLMTEAWDVTALHRPSSDLTFVKRFAPKLTVGSITDTASLHRGIPESTDTVFHVAGKPICGVNAMPSVRQACSTPSSGSRVHNEYSDCTAVIGWINSVDVQPFERSLARCSHIIGFTADTAPLRIADLTTSLPFGAHAQHWSCGTAVMACTGNRVP